MAGVAVAVVLTACGGGGGNASAPLAPASAPAVAAANANVALIRINANADSLNADGTSTKTFTIYALTSGNAAISGATIDLAATNGVILSSPSVVTTSTGATVTMTAASTDQANRISTLTASCSGCSASPATNQVTVTGARITLVNSGASALIVGGASATLSAVVKDALKAPMQGVTVSFAATDSLILGLGTPSSAGVTNSSGVATVTVLGLAVGSASINATALGDAKSQVFTSGLTTTVMAITSPPNNDVMTTAGTKTITVSAPGATTVTFATSIGTFANAATSQVVDVISGTASATLTSSQAGTATITIVDNFSRSASLALVVSPVLANKILLNASQTTLPIAMTTGNQSSLTITARAVFTNGTTDQSVVNVPITFSMLGGPGGGEFLTPALAYTDKAGYATATFTAGTAASIANGITISAAISGQLPLVKTGTSPSNNNILLTIGGQAMSVAFGQANFLGESSDKTLYIQAYSVQVTDSGNHPVPGQVVTLQMRPVAFSLGGACGTNMTTYCSEDANGNGSLDPQEDGKRTLITGPLPIGTTQPLGTVATAGSCPIVPPSSVIGTPDTLLTPPNSDGGSVPVTVTTDASGIAAFNMTYLKNSAYWIVNKLTATVSSNGTESSNSTIFRLTATIPDVGPPCTLPPSPYSY